jgi:NAD(P) transhydrogenase subunit beta
VTGAYVLLAYLVAAVLFILGIRRLSSPRTASSGNAIAAVGMLIAIVGTLVHQDVLSYTTVFAAMVVGGSIGAVSAYTVRMTAMPQMVAMFNGFGGGASALVATAELLRSIDAGSSPELALVIPIVLGVIIGAVTLTGSLIAFAKLQEVMTGQPIVFPLQQPFNVVLGLALLGFGGAVIVDPANLPAFWTAFALASVLGVLLVIPIGGADMPVVISLLNSYSGLAACATGFVLQNQALIISGSLVGASGIILTQIMCRAMNRSLFNVIFSAFGQQTAAGGGASAVGSVKSGSAEDTAVILDAARSVVVVPGYGLAVAQAQHAVRELSDVLGERGIDVKFAIHPVAGRMPGHMNVLLAASGIILTQIMCRAMNRSLFTVIFSAFGQQTGAGGGAAAVGTVKSGSAEDTAVILDAARSVVVVPGYGLAVAQAQHAVRELSDVLGERGIDVKFAIHPVAGRMPGHMNVLLAEADVPYELLVEMDDINPQLPNTDVALVIGANDVTNPAAREDPTSPIFGMPIIEVDRCKTVIVLKRSLNPGFAGIDNPLFTKDNTMMFFGDAKSSIEELLRQIREI